MRQAAVVSEILDAPVVVLFLALDFEEWPGVWDAFLLSLSGMPDVAFLGTTGHLKRDPPEKKGGYIK